MNINRLLNVFKNDIAYTRSKGYTWYPSRSLFDDTEFEDTRLEKVWLRFVWKYDAAYSKCVDTRNMFRRAKTGYGGSKDAWSFDVYLSGIILAGLKNVKAYTARGCYGLSWMAFPPDSPDIEGFPHYEGSTIPYGEDDAARRISHMMYQLALDDMIEGFTLLAEQHGDVDEFGYPNYREWRMNPELQEKADRAKMLFIHFYDDLAT